MFVGDLRGMFADVYGIGCFPSAYAPSELLTVAYAFAFSFADSASSDAEAICVGCPDCQYQYEHE